MRHADEVPRHAFRRGKSLTPRTDPRIEGRRFVLEDIEIGAGEPTFLNRREKSSLVYGVPATDVDDHALFRQTADKPRVEKVVCIRIRWQRNYEPVGAAKKRARNFFGC